MSWFDNALTNLFAPGEVERGQALDAANKARTAELYAKGLITEKERAYAIADVDATSADNYSRQIAEDFVAGAQSGYDAMTTGVKETLRAPFSFAWDSIPWQVLVVAGGVVFWWMGGAALLKGRLAK